MLDRIPAIRRVTVRLGGWTSLPSPLSHKERGKKARCTRPPLLSALAAFEGMGLVLVASLAFAACGSATTTVTTTCPPTAALVGSGSTFDAPLFSSMFKAYAQTGCHVRVSYTGTGSSAGISQLLADTVAFGATDAPMTDAQMASSSHGPIVHVPVTIGAVAVTYNVPEIPISTHLRLTGATLANIFLGKVAFWDDPSITANNPGVALPHQAIHVIHRSDGSGTSNILTHYLSAVSSAWARGPGPGSTIHWPTGTGAKGNGGVASAVKVTRYSIGYNELDYALSNAIQYASIQNADHSAFVVPSIDTVKAASDAATNIPADLRFYIVDEPGAASYPISGFSWVVVYRDQGNADQGTALANLLWWMAHDGQQFATPINYVPLSPSIIVKDEGQIESLQCGSGPCYHV
jgi:phosphate transport system substrate-binding protein